MCAPTKTGWYWWREKPTDDWTCVKVSELSTGLYGYVPSFHDNGRAIPLKGVGEWGERIFPNGTHRREISELETMLEQATALDDIGRGDDGFSHLVQELESFVDRLKKVKI